MALYKEPKRKRIQNEDEILASYRACMDKPKRKYKERKSKYDPELWNALAIHRPSKKMEHGENFEGGMEDSRSQTGTPQEKKVCETKSSLTLDENKSFKEGDTIHSVMPISLNSKQIRSNEEDNNGLQIDTPAKQHGDNDTGCVEQIDLPHYDSSSSNTCSDDYCNTLIVRKILGFLLADNSAIDKRHMMYTLKFDKRLKTACLIEIEKRRQFLNNLNDTILPKLKREQVSLLDILKTLNHCQPTMNDVQEVQSVSSFTGIETVGSPIEEINSSKPLPACYRIDVIENENLTNHDQEANLPSIQLDPFVNRNLETLRFQSKGDVGMLSLENNAETTWSIEKASSNSFQDLEDVDEYLFLPPTNTTYNNTEVYGNTLQNGTLSFDTIEMTNDSNTEEMFRLAEVIANST